MKHLCYKLTDQQMRTRAGKRNEVRWQLGVRVSADLSLPPECCTPGVVHCYDDPYVALLLNPIHANFASPRLFAAEWDGVRVDDRGLKAGVQHLTLVAELPVPVITTSQRVAFGILCTMEVTRNARWREWAERWLSGEDRSRAASYAAADAADDAAAAAAYAAYADADAAAAAAAADAGARLDLPMLAAWAMAFGAEP